MSADCIGTGCKAEGLMRQIRQLHDELAAARALLLEIQDDRDLLRHHDCMPCPGNCDACIMQIRIDEFLTAKEKA